MATQFCPLKTLQSRVNRLIKEQGEDAPCAFWVYTSNDVCSFDDEQEVFHDKKTTADVLANLHSADHIHSAIQDTIADELQFALKRVAN